MKFYLRSDRDLMYDHNILVREYRKFYIWLSPNALTAAKRELLFIQMIEGLHQSEAEIMLLIKDQRLRQRFPSITEAMIREIWPTLVAPNPLTPETVVKIDQLTEDIDSTENEEEKDELIKKRRKELIANRKKQNMKKEAKASRKKTTDES